MLTCLLVCDHFHAPNSRLPKPELLIAFTENCLPITDSEALNYLINEGEIKDKIKKNKVYGAEAMA